MVWSGRGDEMKWDGSRVEKGRREIEWVEVEEETKGMEGEWKWKEEK